MYCGIGVGGRLLLLLLLLLLHKRQQQKHRCGVCDGVTAALADR
jgi:hypothetical protein